jgi:hypothetical protein
MVARKLSVDQFKGSKRIGFKMVRTVRVSGKGR